jgi:integrase
MVMTSQAFEAQVKHFTRERGLNKDGKFVGESTLREYVRHVRRWHEATGAETPTLQDCKPYVIEMADHSPSQAQYAHRALKRYSAWLANFLEVPDALATWKMNIEVEPTKTPVATPADVKAILAVCTAESKTGLRDHAIICVLAYTGMRRSEVARMRWEDVDLVEGTISIPKTKTGKPRKVQMPTAAQKSLLRYHGSLSKPTARSSRNWCKPFPMPEHVWWSHTGQGLSRPLTSNGIQQMLRERSAQAGVAVPAHSLRRHYAVEWLSADGSQAYLQKQAGWKDGRMVARYVSSVAEKESAKEALRVFG